MAKEKKATFCEKFENFIFKTGMIFMLVSTIGLVVGNWLVYRTKYLSDYRLMNLFLLLAATFFVSYIVITLTVFYKYKIRRRICSKSNCLFGVFSLLYIWAYVWIKNFVYSEQTLIVDSFSHSCTDIINEENNNGDMLSEPEDKPLFDLLVLSEYRAD